ncbi:MAG: serine protease [Bryobacterales bacterium]|nr:serine protease [Bryobacterales bacterium]
MRKSSILVVLVICCGLASADVEDHIGVVTARRTNAAAMDPPTSGPLGRGQLVLPEEVILPSLEGAALDRMRAAFGPSWLGPTRPLPAEIEGTWGWTQAGERVWRVTIRATSARALRLRFENFSAEGLVWLYGDELSGLHIGPYEGVGPHGDGGFWSEFVFGEAVTVEYAPRDAAEASEQIPFRIHSIAQIVERDFPVPGEASKPRSPLEPRSIAGCHLDVACYPAMEDRDLPSVAKLYITTTEATGSCTGFLINPRWESDHSYLLLTAGHCVSSEDADIAFLWNYQTEQCYGNPDSTQWEKPSAWTYSSTLVVSKNDSDHDFALLVLDRAEVLAKTGATRRGWSTRVVSSGDQVAAVSHPDGHHKRVAFGQVVSTNWTGWNSSQGIDWRLGTTEPGSSGAPVLWISGEDMRVVGIVTSSNSDGTDDASFWGPYCDADVRAGFDRFDGIYEIIEPYLESESALPALPVVVWLGRSGDNIKLRPTEAGGYTLNGQAIESGHRVTASNANVYDLTLVDGTWTATYVWQRVRVALGDSGSVVDLWRSETGTFVFFDGSVVRSGISAVRATNGNIYRLSFVEGEWVATRLP